MAAKDKFDVNFIRPGEYDPPKQGEWEDTENTLPGALQPYFLRANTGPRWLLGGVMSRPFINAGQCSEKFSISSIEGSSTYKESPLSRWITFPTVDHCFLVQEGLLKVKLKGEERWNDVREGQTLTIAAGQAFTLSFGSRYVRSIAFTDGRGIEQLIQDAGSPFEQFVLPEDAPGWDEAKFLVIAEKLGIEVGDNL